MLNDGASTGEFNMYSVPTLEFQLARQTARRNNAARERKRDAHTGGSTTSRRLPVRRDVPCDLRQQQQIQVMLFRSTGIVLATLPFLPFLASCFPPPSFSPFVPILQLMCLTAYLASWLVAWFSLIYSHGSVVIFTAVLHVRLEIHSLYTAYTRVASPLYFREERYSAGQKFQTISSTISLELPQLL